MSAYPEHDKLTTISDQSQAVYDFLEWMDEAHGARLCEIPRGLNDTWFPVTAPIRKLLAEHFDIDLDLIEKEKRAMLDALRATGN